MHTYGRGLETQLEVPVVHMQTLEVKNNQSGNSGVLAKVHNEDAGGRWSVCCVRASVSVCVYACMRV